MSRIRGLPPGRAGAQWLRRRQATAERAAGLLDVRLRLLRAERDRFTDEAERTGEQWRQACAEADRWLLRAALLGHRRGLRLAGNGATAEVTLSWRTTMGVHHPAGAQVALPPDSAAAGSPGSAALVAAAAATREALAAAVTHAAAAGAVRRLDAEITVTRRRLHAVDDRWLPRLRSAAAAVRLELDEQERAEAARLHWAAGATGTGDGRRAPPQS